MLPWILHGQKWKVEKLPSQQFVKLAKHKMISLTGFLPFYRIRYGKIKIDSIDSQYSADENNLPSTGVDKEWEHQLSSVYVVTPEEKNYGTRSQAVLLIDHENNLTFIERTKQLPSLKTKTISQTISNNNDVTCNYHN
jgi:hypothetical protein